MSDDRAAKPKFVALKVDPLSTIRDNKFITQGEKFSRNRDSEGESFLSNISSPPLKRRYKRYGFSYLFVMPV